MLTSLFTESTTTNNIELSSILLCTLASLGLGLVVAFTHMFTSKHNKNFLITLAVLPVLVEVVMLMVNGNLGTSVAILGAFGLVRFRSIPGTSKEILSVFFAMAIGLATGMGQLGFATIMTFTVAAAIIILSKVPVFGFTKTAQILKITVPEDLDYTTIFDEIFDKYLVKFELEKSRTTDMGSLFDLNYRVILKSGTNEKEFIDAIRERNGNLRVILSMPVLAEAEI